MDSATIRRLVDGAPPWPLDDTPFTATYDRSVDDYVVIHVGDLPYGLVCDRAILGAVYYRRRHPAPMLDLHQACGPQAVIEALTRKSYNLAPLIVRTSSIIISYPSAWLYEMTERIDHNAMTFAAVMRFNVKPPKVVAPRLPWAEHFNPRWRTDATMSLARVIAENKAYDRLPILRDALLDADCDNEHILDRIKLLPADAKWWPRDCWLFWELMKPDNLIKPFPDGLSILPPLAQQTSH